MSPTAIKLLEVSMNEEDPVIAKKRIDRRISNRNINRFHQNQNNVGTGQQHPKEKGNDMFRPWDDKPDVTLSMQNKKNAPKPKKDMNQSMQ